MNALTGIVMAWRWLMLFLGGGSLGPLQIFPDGAQREAEALGDDLNLNASGVEFGGSLHLVHAISSHGHQDGGGTGVGKGGPFESLQPITPDTAAPHSFHKRQEFRNPR